MKAKALKAKVNTQIKGCAALFKS